jgi:hypothetical protein
VGGNELRILYRPAVLQICRDAVARNVWQQVEEGSAASCERRCTIRSTSVRVIGFAVIFPLLVDAPEERRFLLVAYAGRVEIGIEACFYFLYNGRINRVRSPASWLIRRRLGRKTRFTG